MSGSVSTRTANMHAEAVTASGQLRLPACWAALPAKSSTRRSPSTLGAQAQLQIALGRLEHVARLAHAVAERRQAGARAPLAVVEHLVGALAQPLGPEARGELAEALGADAVGRQLRAQVGARAPRAGASRATSSSSASLVERRGAITTPSSSSVRLSAGIEPGRRPPTSAWWARLAAKPIERAARRRRRA